jgi:pseudouridine kinase
LQAARIARVWSAFSGPFQNQSGRDFQDNGGSTKSLRRSADAVCAATIQTAFSLAKKTGIPVCADPTSASLAPKLKKYLPRLHLITPTATEAGILTGRPFPANDRKAAIEAARMLVSQGVDIAIVTLAEFGVCYATSETNGHIPAIRTQILDPTGAGDAMTAAIQGLIEKITQLPPQRMAEVEDFVDFLRAREDEQRLTHATAKASEASFAQVWDNDEDAAYDCM